MKSYLCTVLLMGLALASKVYAQALDVDEAARLAGVTIADKDKPDVYGDLGNRFLAEGNPQQALAMYEKALSLNPAHQGALNNKGVALKRLGRYDEAITAFKRALKNNPRHHEALYNLACAQALSGQPDAAVSSLKSAISLNPSYRNAAATDPDFRALAGSSEFRALLR